MKIIGFNIHKLSIERKNLASGEIKLQNKLDISDITTEEVPISKSPALKFEFSFEINYEPKIAHLEITGSVLALDDDNEGKEILKQWKAKKEYSHDSKIAILNFIMSKCNLKALQMEDELGLPLHLPFPKITANAPVSENKAKYTG